MKQLNDLIADFWRDYAALVLLAGGLLGVLLLIGFAIWAKRSKKPLRPLALAFSMNLALLLNAEGMWVIAIDQLKLPAIFAVLVFAVFEICFLTATSLAAEQYRRTSVHAPDGTVVTPGHPGAMLWIAALIAGLSGVIVASNAVTFTEKLLRLAVPCVIFLMWWAALTAAGQRVRRGRFAYSPRRLAERWGFLIPDDDPDLVRMAAERQIRRMVVNYHRVSAGRLPKSWWRSRLLKDARTAGEPVVEEVIEQLARIQRVMDLLVPGGTRFAAPVGSLTTAATPGSLATAATPGLSGLAAAEGSSQDAAEPARLPVGAGGTETAPLAVDAVTALLEPVAMQAAPAPAPAAASSAPAPAAASSAPAPASPGASAGQAVQFVEPVQFVQPAESPAATASSSVAAVPSVGAVPPVAVANGQTVFHGQDSGEVVSVSAGHTGLPGQNGSAVAGDSAVVADAPMTAEVQTTLSGHTASGGQAVPHGQMTSGGRVAPDGRLGSGGDPAAGPRVAPGGHAGPDGPGASRRSSGGAGAAVPAQRGAGSDAISASPAPVSPAPAATPSWASTPTGARPAVSIAGSPWWRLAVDRLSKMVAQEISADDLPEMNYLRTNELARKLAPRVQELGEGVVRTFINEYVRELDGDHVESAYPWRDFLPAPAVAPAGSEAWRNALVDLRTALEEELGEGQPMDPDALADLLAPSAPRLDDVTIRGFVGDYLLALSGMTAPGNVQPWADLLPRPQPVRAASDEDLLDMHGAELFEHLRATGRLSRYKVQAITGIKSRVQADRIKSIIEERSAETATA
ncbi:MFS transporter [Actinoplanes sp. NEAU-A12]|uniref:MFS transporter n=1 Tax=Actinoplanes sandaracinus TaxID=3045177 RepID=A0ABT6WMY1_9ACTN|nr:MFS transporter [Actinoplanes sandaracinus]MDI6101100.1 MFS transporter [Actinoplanes sandaracinus]